MMDRIKNSIPGIRWQNVYSGFLNVLTIVLLLVLMFPIYWVFSTAIRPEDLYFTIPTPLIPTKLSVEPLYTLLFETGFPRWYLNSIVVAVGVMVFTTFVATLGGYGLARIDLPYKYSFARAILFGYMFPAILLAIPMYIVWRMIGILNSYVGLILALTAIALPFSLWMMWKTFLALPYSIEESAQIAGAPPMQAFAEVTLPNAKPGIIAVAIFAYEVAWNSFTIPKILMNDQEMWVATVGMESFVVQEQVLWGSLMGAVFMTIIPSFILLYYFQKYLLLGFRVSY